MHSHHHHHGRHGGHHRGHHRGHHHPHGADDATALPVAEEDGAPAKAARLFVCSAKSCRAAGSAELIEALRQRIQETGADADVRACGCQDCCDDGPVVVAHGGAAAKASKPPKGALARMIHRPLARFQQASADQADIILDHVVAKTR